MDSKKLINYALGLAGLFVAVWVVSKSWKAGQK
jgi:hypothetical protein